MNFETYHDLLNFEFERRREINSYYSLRCFARDLQLSAPRLSLILNKKRGLSTEAANDVALRLGLDEKTKKWFCNSAGALHSRGKKQREAFNEKILEYKKQSSHFDEIQLEFFKVISDWYHFALLEATYLDDFQSDPKWISDLLGIEFEQTIEAIERLKKLELLKVVDGEYVDTFEFLATPNDIPSPSLKKYNLQLMKKAMTSLYEQDVSEREYSSTIFPISKKELATYKQRIRDFRRGLDKDSRQDPNKDAVYCLGIQFFELTNQKILKKNKNQKKELL